MQQQTTSALHPRLQPRADKLAQRLAAANRRVYREALARHASALGAQAPRHVRSPTVLAAIAERARVSAASITQTEADRRLALYQQTGSVPRARAAYREWTQQRAGMIARYEAGRAAQAAATDFYERNVGLLGGEEWIEPDDAAVEDECADAIAQGRQPLGTFDAPYHPNCPHAVARSYGPPDDPGRLWVGGAEADAEDKAGFADAGDSMIDYFGAELELKTVSTSQRLLIGHAAVHSNIDRVRDIVDPGASQKAISRLGAPADVVALVGHDGAQLPVGIPQRIEATPQGLYTETYVLKGPAGDNLLAVAKDLLDHGQSLGLSIGFKTRDSRMEHTARGRCRRILDYDLKEYSFACQQAIANPLALVSAVKSRRGAGGERREERKAAMQYRAEQQGERWLVRADTDADGDEDDNRLIGTYPSADIAGAVAAALSSQDYQEEQDDMPPDDDERTGRGSGSTTKTAPQPWSPTAADLAALPNASYLYLEEGADDDEGKRVPRSKRHFPCLDGEGKVAPEQVERALAALPTAQVPGLDGATRAQLAARAHRMLAAATEGKTYQEPLEWQSGAPLSVYGLGHRLIALSEQLAGELKAMALLGDEVKGYSRIRPALREELRGAQKDLGTLLDFAETIDRGEDGQQRLAALKAQLALNAV